MKVICREDLNLILDLPLNKEVIVGKLKYNSEVISFEKRIANLYMDSIGFTPHMKGNHYQHYRAEYNDRYVEVSHYSTHNNCSSVGNSIDMADSDIIKPEILLNGFTFVKTVRKEEIVEINKYQINKAGDDFELVQIDDLKLFFRDKNLRILRQNSEVDISEVNDFFNHIDYSSHNMYNTILGFIFDNFVDEKGFIDIYKEFKNIIRDIADLDKYDSFRYLYYVGQIDFYYLAEYFIKNNLEEKIKLHNPVFTGKPIERIEDIPMLSKVGMEIKKAYRFDEEDTELLFKMEAHKRIGKDGLKIIYDYIKQIDAIDNSWNSPFSTWRKDVLFTDIYSIIDTFDITPKNLMNRFVRAMFNENISINTYAKIIQDTIEMANALDIDLGEKLPSNILRTHDLLKDQIRYIRNKEVEDRFKFALVENNKLLNVLPASDTLTILSPSTPNDLVDEGMRLNHCVGSYIDRYVSGYSKIFFVRRKSNEREPFVTLELNRNNEFVQISGFSNRKPNKEVIDFVNEWLGNL